MNLTKSFKFDKVAYTSNRRVNLPVVEMELRYINNDPNKPELSICGEIWNATHTDIVMCGQCLDQMAKFESLRCDPLFKKLYRLWQNFHLNGMNAGTLKQSKALKDANRRFESYEDQCKYLESIGLLVDDGYEYGSEWLYRSIPEDDLNEIKSLLAD